MPDGRVEFEITADGKKAYASINDITEQLQKSGVKWEKSAKESTDNIGNSFEGMLKKITAAFSAAAIGKALVDFGKQAIEAASDLSEVQNVVDTTFGEKGAATIESWAKKAGSQFGLTETQAKRFTSTLGSMMKSAGLAGDEIVSMSTDMAGLAADMASFYNLDFDTAFQKIRSGISGETEPLKQLGVNMSVANLEAFALQQGLSKTFSEMTQGEQTILRYQYLMQATSDAQGDFEKTSDGFANATRRVETAVETLKTKAGELLMNVVEPLTTSLAGFLEDLTTDPNRTVLDEFKEIDANTEKKLAEITKAAEDARTLLSTLGEIEQKSKSAKENLEGAKVEITDKTAENAKTLSENLSKIEKSTVKDTDFGDNSTFGKSIKKAAENAAKLAEDLKLDEIHKQNYSLEGSPLYTSISDMSSNASDTYVTLEKVSTQAGSAKSDVKDINEEAKEGYVTLTKISGSAGTTKKTLTDTKDIDLGENSKLGSSIETIKENAEGITASFNSLQSMDYSLEGKAIYGSIKTLATYATDTKVNLEGASEALEKVGESGASKGVSDFTEETQKAADVSDEWLEVCKRLVQTIPGLTSIIDTQTGEIKGGTAAVEEYIDTWERAQKNLVLIDANQQKHTALDSKYAELPGLEIDMRVAEKRVRDSKAQLDALYKKYGLNLKAEDGQYLTTEDADAYGISSDVMVKLNNELDYYEQLSNELDSASQAYQKQKEAYDEAKAALEEADRILVENMSAKEKAALITDKYAEAQRAAAEAVDLAAAAVQDYRKNAIETATQSVEKLITGFKKIEIPGADDLPKPDEMTSALQSQLTFMQTYQENLQKAKEAGLDENLLAELSDGSEESAKYLQTIADNPSQIEKINELYRSVNEEKKTFAESLADSQLEVDDAYQALLKTEQDARDQQKEVEDAIAKNAGDCIAQMAANINANAGALESAISNVNSILSKLGLSSFTLGSFGLDGSHETGLNYVPFNGYLAELHEGEGILTAEENRIWQNFKANQHGVDYDQLGGVMRDNVKTGGNVYLDRKIVGSVVSDIQGDQYRSLKRSGWQA